MSPLDHMKALAAQENRAMQATLGAEVWQRPRGAALPSPRVRARREEVMKMKESGMSGPEIAAETGLTLSTVHADFMYARQAMGK